MLLVIDNYDSFTFNLVQYFGELGAEVQVFRHDKIGIADIHRLNPDRILISPGPGTPDDAGISCEVIRVFGPRKPLLGVCLGHQCIGRVYGGNIRRADRLMHGKTSPIAHDNRIIFAGMPQPFNATRYHSLIVDRTDLPGELEICGWTEEEEIMGLRHKEYPVHGVQFHPESILTDEGRRLLANFLSL